VRLSSRLTSASLAAALALGTAVALVASPTSAAAATATVRGTYVPLSARTVIDTRSGAAKNHKGAIGAKRTIKFQIAGRAGVPKSAGAVLLRLTAVKPSRSGSLVAYKAGLKAPNIATLQFTGGGSSTGTAYIQLSGTGRIVITNRSSAPVQVVAVVAGYYRAGTVDTPGSVVPVTPKRLANSVLARGAQPAVQIAGRAGVPKGAAAVVAVLSATGATRAGSAFAWQNGTARPAPSTLRFAAHQYASTLAVVPLASGGAIRLRNNSAGRVRLVLDVVGYVAAGAPSAAGATGVVAAAGVAARSIKAGARTAIQVTGRGGVPALRVRTVTAILTVTGARTNGTALVYKSGGSSTRSTAAQVRAGKGVSALVSVPVSSTGKIELANKTSGKATLSFAVVGYTLSAALPAPKVSRSHYIRTTGSLQTLGVADARAGSTLVVLHLGAQLNDKTGVLLSASSTRVAYASLVAQLQGYLTGFGSRRATVAIATNNDANDWSGYTAAARGQDWANKVVDQLRGGSGVTVVGANDIEWGFYSTAQQALLWESAYLGAATTKQLIFTGSADGCPTAFGSNASCNWTLAQQYQIAGGRDSRIKALPQIYNAAQAAQWANIDRAGGRGISFLGALTQRAAAPTQSWTPQQAYPAFWNALAAVGVTGLPAAVTDLNIVG